MWTRKAQTAQERSFTNFVRSPRITRFITYNIDIMLVAKKIYSLRTQVLYFIRPDYWLQGLYNQAEHSHVLHQDAYVRNVSDVRLSRGYKEKVLENPIMNRDKRNVALIGTSDGVPLFRKENSKRMAVPFVLRVAGDEPFASQLENLHLTALQSGEFWYVYTAYIRNITGYIRDIP
jgi:hypothetical protein